VPAGRRMDYNRRVIAVSLECIKTLIVKLDKEGDLGSDGVTCVMNNFSPSEATNNPLDLLDSLILYLFHVHRVDWYSSTWRVGTASSLTVREGRDTMVTAAGKEGEELVEQKLVELRDRTEKFVKVLLQHKFSTKILDTNSQDNQPAGASREPETPPSATRCRIGKHFAYNAKCIVHTMHRMHRIRCFVYDAKGIVCIMLTGGRSMRSGW
jgi:hypothetical protein